MIHRMLACSTAVIVLGLASAIASAETYLLVPNVQGDSVAKGHEKWLTIAAIAWEVEADSSWTKGGGASVGKPNPGKIVLKLATGPWSSAFLRAITTGVTVDKPGAPIFLDHVTTDGRLLVRARLDGFFATKYKIATASQEFPQDQLEAVFRNVRLEFYCGASDCKVAPTALEWDIVTMKTQ